jgi:ribosomal protein L3 glutamine methyltransferase
MEFGILGNASLLQAPYSRSPVKSTPEPRTARELIQHAARRFRTARLHFGHGTDNALDEAAYLVLGALGLPFDEDAGRQDALLPSERRRQVLELVERRIAERRPVAYLINRAWFAGLEFYVDERVLVPRSPIAELIEQRFRPWIEERQVRNIVDLGTGSGCIAIACALAFPRAAVDAVDTSAAALEVARRNVDLHDAGDRVRCVQSDLFEALDDARYDLVIANLPYVPAASMAVLPPEYRHEPRTGLEAGEDGLDVLRRLLDTAADHMNRGAILVGEVGEAQQTLMHAYPRLPFTWLEFERGGEGVFLLTEGDLGDR